MMLKYPILIMIFLMAIEGSNATNHSIPVGIHDVSFNASLPIIDEITSSPVLPGNYGLNYTKTSTTLWHDRPIITVIVRDFENPMPDYALFLEEETLEELMDYVPLGNRSSIHYIGNPIAAGGYISGIVRNHKGEYFGALMAWPSDRVEIIITGSLPSKEIWIDISQSIELLDKDAKAIDS